MVSATFAIFRRELTAASRGEWYYLARAIYLVLLFTLVLSVWGILLVNDFGGLSAGYAPTRRMAEAGERLLLVFAFTQLILVLAVAPAVCCDLVASERRRRTMDLLTVSGHGPWRIVWNKWLSRMLMMGLLVLSSATAI